MDLSDESNEQHLLNCFRTSSMILVLMKQFDEFYFAKVRPESSYVFLKRFSLVNSMVYRRHK